MRTYQLQVEGATCGSCTSAIHTTVSGLENVQAVQVTLVGNKRAEVTCSLTDKADPNTLRESIRSAVVAIGFDPNMKTWRGRGPTLQPASSLPTDTAAQRQLENIALTSSLILGLLMTLAFQAGVVLSAPLLWATLALTVIMLAVSCHGHWRRAKRSLVWILPSIIAGVLLSAFGWLAILAAAVTIAATLFAPNKNMSTLIALSFSLAIMQSTAHLIAPHLPQHLLIWIPWLRGQAHLHGILVMIFMVGIGSIIKTRALSRVHHMLRQITESTASWPEQSLIIQNGQKVAMATRELRKGHILHLQPGQVVPCDGKLMTAATMHNQRWTGDSHLKAFSTGQRIQAGYVNGPTEAYLQLTSTPQDSSLSQLRREVRAAIQKTQRAEYTTIDKVSKHLIAGLVVLAVLVSAAWVIIGGLSMVQASTIFMGMLMSVCPCVLALATPLAHYITLSYWIKQGLLCEQPAIMTRASRVDVICFDYNRTLTDARELAEGEQPRLGTDTLATLTAINNMRSSLFPTQRTAIACHILSGGEDPSYNHGRTAFRALTRHASALSDNLLQCHFGCSPEDKRKHIEALQQQGLVVAMVGEGTNDAPAMAQADISFCLPVSDPEAQQAGDVRLLTPQLMPIAKAIRSGRAMTANINVGLAMAMIYNTAAIALSAGTWYALFGHIMPPMLCSMLMTLFSGILILNAYRLQYSITRTERVTVRPVKSEQPVQASRLRTGSLPTPRRAAKDAPSSTFTHKLVGS